MAGLPRRIIKETQRLMQEPVPGISAVPDDGNARYFHVVVAGPEGSPFEGGVFKLELFLPEDYPMSAPKVGLLYTHFLVPPPTSKPKACLNKNWILSKILHLSHKLFRNEEPVT